LSGADSLGGILVKLKVVVHPAEEGGFWAEVPALPGCVSEGETLAETLANIREAAEGWLEVADRRAPDDTNAQLVEIEL
jgi:predicted RNase H-like HicB family nuclease